MKTFERAAAFAIASATLSFGIVAGAPTAASAFTSPQPCMKHAMTTIAMEDCYAAATKKDDAQLNTLYAKALAALAEDQRPKLRAAEQDWITFRNADCQVYEGKTTGTIAFVETESCVLRHTDQRITDLGSFLEP